MGAFYMNESNKMNISETINPLAMNETYIEGAVKQRSDLKIGDTIARDYVVKNELNKRGSQASLYIVEKDGRKYVVKMYSENYSPIFEVVNELKKNECDYVAELLDYGFESGQYFEIYKYYSKGTLEDKGKCSYQFLKDVVVPQLNEGLRYLHSLTGKGVVHGDLKPSNIFLSNDESKVIIGDFGICSYLDDMGRSVDVIKGTPEYAPRSYSLFGTTARKPSYDYGALGLVLLKLATGYSIFDGLELSEIVEKWEDGIEIPTSINGRLQKLIKGLIDENEHNRFAYKEVKRWTDGSYVKNDKRHLYSINDFTEKKKKPMIFGIFDGEVQSVATLNDLAFSIVNHWDHTKKLLERRSFIDFIDQFDQVDMRIVEGFIKNCKPDEAIFKLLYSINPMKNIVYKGVDFGSVKELIQHMGQSSTELEEFINFGLFDFYLKVNGYSPENIVIIQKVIEDFKKSPDLVVQIIRFILGGSDGLRGSDWRVDTIEDFKELILKKSVDEINELTNNVEVLAWLYKVGYRNEVKILLDLEK